MTRADWGRGRALLFLLALLLGTVVLGNWRAVEVDPQTGRTAILDADSVWRLRRMALALESSRLGQLDSSLSFPNSAGEVALPVFDHSVSFALRVLSAGRVGGPQRAVNEQLLMRAALWVGPVLGALLALGAFLWVRSMFGVTRRAAAYAALGVALLPAVLSASQAGSLVIESLAVLFLLLATGAVSWMFRARSPLDRFTLAMIAGGAFGVGLATTPLFLIPTLGVWSAVLFESLRSEKETRAEWVRALLLFGITAALGALLPSLGGPWLPSPDGIVRGWTDLCVKLSLAGLLPFMLLLWFPSWIPRVHVRQWLPGALVLLGVLAASLARAFGADHESCALLFASVGLDGNSGPEWIRWPSLLALVLIGLFAAGECARAWRAEWTATGVLLVVWGAGTFVVACFHEPAALFFVPLFAACFARRMDRPALAWNGSGLVALLALAAWDSQREHTQPDHEGLAALAAARELRESSNSPGPWNTIHAVHDWGVLADARLAPLVVWYGRRPCASLGPFRNADLAGRETLLLALEMESLPAFHDRARELGLRWILWGSASAQRLPAYPGLLLALDQQANLGSAGSEGQPGAVRLLAIPTR